MIFLLVGLCQSAFARGEVLLFPQVSAQHRQGETWTLRQVTPSLDIFATWESGRARILAEAYLSEHEHHIERLQFGYRLGTAHTLWLGRFHTPSDGWNTRYHHGAYVQTSISRPAISEFHDLGGVLVTHNTGLLLEGRRTLGESALEWAAYIGLGPELANTASHHGDDHEDTISFSLEDLDVLRPDRLEHDLSTGIQVSYQPDGTPNHHYGLFANHTRIPAVDEHFKALYLDAFGLFGLREFAAWRVQGAFYAVRDKLRHDMHTDSDTFSAAYLQLEYSFADNWTGYGRIEDSWDTQDSAYLDLVPAFLRSRGLLGLRYDFGSRQALTLEISRNHDASDSYGQVQFSWSAVFP